MLRQMDPSATDKLWNGWLARYWHDRLQGVLGPLAPPECRQMLEWLPHLGEHFPAAVQLAIRMPPLAAEYSHSLFDLRESDLVDRFPEATASLLIYLADGIPAYQVADLAQVAARLGGLAEPLRSQLREALARAGVG